MITLSLIFGLRVADLKRAQHLEDLAYFQDITVGTQEVLQNPSSQKQSLINWETRGVCF